jgi:hypothetical protein
VKTVSARLCPDQSWRGVAADVPPESQKAVSPRPAAKPDPRVVIGIDEFKSGSAPKPGSQ